MAFESREVVASAVRGTNGNSGALRPIHARNVALTVDVTAATGTLDLAIEWSHDGTAWAPGETADAFAQIGATKKTTKRFDVKAPLYRIVWTVGGVTPSFTFAVHEYTT